MITTQPKAMKKCYFGVVEAIVCDINDPEKEGRIQVSFPWFDANTRSDWCRVSQPYAGNGYGQFWTPELGDEVLVAFIHGDMRQPIVIGGLFNGVDKPPSHRADDKDEKVLRTKAGHEIRFVDTDGEEKIVIVDKSEKHRIEVSTKDSSITISSDGGKITLTANEIEIKADTSLKMDATTIEATATGSMTLKGQPINLN